MRNIIKPATVHNTIWRLPSLLSSVLPALPGGGMKFHAVFLAQTEKKHLKQCCMLKHFDVAALVWVPTDEWRFCAAC